MDAESFETLVLSLTEGVGYATFRRLVEEFGSAAGALAAPESRLVKLARIGPETARKITSSRKEAEESARREMELASRHGVRLLAVNDPSYPEQLKNIYDPPLVLYVRGELVPQDALSVAIVGARRCTAYGRAQAERLAMGLANLGVTIVSGLARGIDSAAHRGALAPGGRTVAVLGNGLSTVYPPENEELAAKVVSRGALLSEFPMEARVARENFPRRNRVISGLSLGVVVVEGTRTSGALITARHAQDQNREVFAVPGRIDSPLTQGPHALIKSGAKLVESMDDILEELGPLADRLRKGDTISEGAPELRLSSRERKVLSLLSAEPRPIDEIIAEAGLAPKDISSTLMVLEIKRLCKQLPGKSFVRSF